MTDCCVGGVHADAGVGVGVGVGVGISVGAARRGHGSILAALSSSLLVFVLSLNRDNLF